MRKNITIIGVNYYPEDSSTGLYSTQLSEYLAKSYNVEVVTGFPYYPEWKLRKEYKNKNTFHMEKRRGVGIYRYKQYTPSRPDFKRRVLQIISFTIGSFFNVLKIKKCNLVICMVPFTSSIILGLLLAKLKGARVWIHIQDFEFDAAIESGLLKGRSGKLNAITLKYLFSLEKKLLNRADIVSTISSSMIDRLELKTKIKGYYLPNWIDEDFINPINFGQHAFLKSKKFKVLYSGNIGDKQDWDLFIKVLESFKDSDNIEFIVVGAGSKKNWLVKKTKDCDLVSHHAPIEYRSLSDLLCSADMHILLQKNEIVDTVMPSKLLGMMASARPSVVAGNIKSEVAGILNKSKGGFFYNNSDFDAIVKTIKRLSADTEASKKIGNNARNYVINQFSMEKVMLDFSAKVEKIIKIN